MTPEKTCSTADPETMMLVEILSIITQYGTRYAKNVMSKPKQVGESSMMAHPPMDWIASVKILLRKVEEFIEFIDGCLCLPLEV
jgi:hypothetical protein